MTRQPLVARRAEELLGAAVVATAPVAGGDIATATRLRLSDGTTALMKTLPHAPDGFFEAEARGLRWLAEAGGVAVPEVLAVDQDCLILRVGRAGQAPPPTPPPTSAARWRATHAAGAAVVRRWTGTASSAGCRCPTAPADTWAEFFAVRRVLPYLKLARDRGAVDRHRRRGRRGASSAGSPTWCPRSRRPGCTATCGTATCCGARRPRLR